MALKEQLKKFLEECGERKVAILGIGSKIRGDDAVGLEVVEQLEERLLKDVLLLKTETVPESFTGVLREFEPTHVLMIDAAHLDGSPGEARIIPTQMIRDVCISTHKLPLTILVNYLKGTLGSKAALIGIQPQSIAFGTEITPELKTAAQEVASVIYEAISQSSCAVSDIENQQ